MTPLLLAAALACTAPDAPEQPAAAAVVVAPAPQDAGITRGRVGAAMVASGAAVAVGSTVVLTLVETFTTPDRRRSTVDPTTESFNSVVGFITAAAVSVSAIVIVTGAGLAISDP